MSFNIKNKRNRDGGTEKPDIHQRMEQPDRDFEEADKLLEQLEIIENRRKKKPDLTSKAKQVIQNDQESIRKMQDRMEQLASDDLDYLDDEKYEDSVQKKPNEIKPKINTQETSKETNKENNKENNNSGQKKNNKRKKGKKKQAAEQPVNQKKNVPVGETTGVTGETAKKQVETSKKENEGEPDVKTKEAVVSDKTVKPVETEKEEPVKNEEVRKEAVPKEVEEKVDPKEAGSKESDPKETDPREPDSKDSTGDSESIVNKGNAGESEKIQEKTEKKNREKQGGKKQNHGKQKKSSLENEKKENNQDKDEVKLDFFDKVLKPPVKNYTKLRKKKPNKLHEEYEHIDLKKLFFSSRKYMIVGSAVVTLCIIMLIALINDRSVSDADGKDVVVKVNKATTQFLKDLDTKEMVDTVNGYYDALVKGDVSKVREFLYDCDSVSDEEILKRSEEIKVYHDLVGTSFHITDCKLQKGLKNNEYISYMKFEVKIKDINTPAVGVFTYYLIDDPDKETKEDETTAPSETTGEGETKEGDTTKENETKKEETTKQDETKKEETTKQEETKEGDTTKENETKAQEATTKETSKETVSHHYKLYIGLNNPETKVYKYVSKMKKADNVVEFFDQVNKELEEACNQDAKLKVVVDALLGDALRDS